MDTDEVKKLILQGVPDATIYVTDPHNDGLHLEALVISPSFESKMMVEQQRMVLRPLWEAFNYRLHALSLKTFSPSEWEANQHRFSIDTH